MNAIWSLQQFAACHQILCQAATACFQDRMAIFCQRAQKRVKSLLQALPPHAKSRSPLWVALTAVCWSFALVTHFTTASVSGGRSHLICAALFGMPWQDLFSVMNTVKDPKGISCKEGNHWPYQRTSGEFSSSRTNRALRKGNAADLQ